MSVNSLNSSGRGELKSKKFFFIRLFLLSYAILPSKDNSGLNFIFQTYL